MKHIAIILMLVLLAAGPVVSGDIAPVQVSVGNNAYTLGAECFAEPVYDVPGHSPYSDCMPVGMLRDVLDNMR